MTEEVLTVEETAKFLKMHENTVRSMAESGELPAKKAGGQWRFLHSSLMEYLKSPNVKTKAVQ